jgi:Fe-S-cluster-containing dehydrogenase component
VLAKDDQGIIVITDAGRCISCTQKPCVAACPYGAIDVDSKTGRIHKCDMCKDLIADNKSPACIAGCLINSWFYGDLNDPDSLVSQLLESWSGYTHQLKPQSGNQPNVHFLLSKKQWNDMDGFYSQNWHE